MSSNYLCPKCSANLIEGSAFCEVCGTKIVWGSAYNVVPDSTANTKSSNSSIVGIVVAFVALIVVAVAGTIVVYKTFASNNKENHHNNIAVATTEATLEESTTEMATEAVTVEPATTETVDYEDDSDSEDEKLEEYDYYLGAWDEMSEDGYDYDTYKFSYDGYDYRAIIPEDYEETDRSEENDYAAYENEKGARIIVKYVENKNNYSLSKYKKLGKKFAGKYGKVYGKKSLVNSGDDWVVISYNIKDSDSGKKFIYYSVCRFADDRDWYQAVTLIYPEKMRKEYDDPGPPQTIQNYVINGESIKKIS